MGTVTVVPLVGEAVDTGKALSQIQLQALWTAGVTQILLDVATPGIGATIQAALDVGMTVGFFQGYYPPEFASVTWATQRADGALSTVRQALGTVPQGVTIGLDFEAVPSVVPVPQRESWVNLWAKTIAAAGAVPGLYRGAGAGLTGEQLWELAVVRYWGAPGSPAIPHRGYDVHQVAENVSVNGVTVDRDLCGRDALGDYWTGLRRMADPTAAPPTPDIQVQVQTLSASLSGVEKRVATLESALRQVGQSLGKV